MAHNAGIPKIIIDDALRYHKKLSEQKTFRGMNRDGFIAASIYIASLVNNYPRTSKEIATIFHLDGSSASKGCKNAVSIMNNIENSVIFEIKTDRNDNAWISKIIRQVNIVPEPNSKYAKSFEHTVNDVW